MLEETIMEEREELMVSLKHTKTHDPARKLGPFLKPTCTLTNLEKPFCPNDSCEGKMCSLRVSFNGWRTQQKGWKEWVDSMHSLHKSTWKKAGIYEAVLNSCYEIKKDDNLILGFVQKWCHETKSFVFSWGEVTVTLEDMMVIGGYSVLGQSVDFAVENEDLGMVLEKLTKSRTEISRSTYNKAHQFGWIKKFKDSGSDIEHEAFLVLWLCRFVFPSSLNVVMKDVLAIGIQLARGVKLALGPAVLASIYRDLSLLKAKMVGSKDNDHNDETAVTVWAPFQLVQVWIWERFCKLRPNPSYTCIPRFAKWDKKLPVKDVSLFVGSALEEFCWQPYGEDSNDRSVFSKVYQDSGTWVVVDDCLDGELEAWARCLRVSELVGIDGNCIEQYLPHRVAMQFGMNQDVPGDVVRTNETPEVAWEFYSRPVKDVKLYIPSRVSEPCVTSRYLEWRNKSSGSCKLSSRIGEDKAKNLVKSELRTEGSEEAMGNNDGGGGDDDDDDDVNGGGDDDDEIIALGLELEARISKLEEVFLSLKQKVI